MRKTLKHIYAKWNLNGDGRLPVEIPNTTREDLARLFADLGYRTGAEIGVEQGLFSETICRANPGVKHYCVDAWEGYAGYRDHVNQEKLDGFYAAAERRLAGFNAIMVKGYSVPTAAAFADKSLDYVYIDANHGLEYVIADIAAWAPKVRRGGIIAGHDYRKHVGRPAYVNHVVHAVNTWTEAKQISPWFVLGRKDDPEGPGRDRNRSWFWVAR